MFKMVVPMNASCLSLTTAWHSIPWLECLWMSPPGSGYPEDQGASRSPPPPFPALLAHSQNEPQEVMRAASIYGQALWASSVKQSLSCKKPPLMGHEKGICFRAATAPTLLGGDGTGRLPLLKRVLEAEAPCLFSQHLAGLLPWAKRIRTIPDGGLLNSSPSPGLVPARGGAAPCGGVAACFLQPSGPSVGKDRRGPLWYHQ